MSASSLLLVFAVGMLMPLQAGVNGLLAKTVGHPLRAALLQNSVGATFILTVLLLTGAFHYSAATLAQTRWWYWVGGLCGATLVVSALYFAPRIGAATFFITILAGQLSASLLFEHFGLVGYPVRPISVARIAGVLCVGLGIWLLRRA
ncbi:MAG: DMT family transporter [Polyangiales bacterium]